MTRWYSVVERELYTDPGEATRRAEKGARELLDILESSEFTMQSWRYHMTRNPLLLTTLCLVHHDLGRLPHARAKLYEESVAVLLERWRHRLTEVSPLSAEDAVQVLQPVAQWMHEHRHRRATKAELLAPAEQGLATLRHVRMRAETFLDEIRDESGLLTSWGTDHYGFMHLGFQEFLTAQQLRNEGLKDPRVFEDLAQWFGDSWWQEVILLMLALRNPSVFVEFMRHVVRRPEFEQWADTEMMELIFEQPAEVSPAPFVELLHIPEEYIEPEHKLAVLKVVMRRMPEVIEGDPALRRLRDERIGHASRARIRTAREGQSSIVSPRGGVELVWIPGGSFMMGSVEEEEGRDSYPMDGRWREILGDDPEGPRHRVRLSGFFLARTPVTNAQYAEYLKATPEARKPEHWGDRRYNQPDQPVVGISWHEARAYSEWAGLQLPTEAQWEHACRAGTETRYCLGNREEDLARVAWYTHNSANRLHAVAELEPNALGLYDMHGNIWEWCFDEYGPYATEPRAVDGLRHDPECAAFRVLRGGSFYSRASDIRSACRRACPPESRWRFRGFRPARLHPAAAHINTDALSQPISPSPRATAPSGPASPTDVAPPTPNHRRSQ